MWALGWALKVITENNSNPLKLSYSKMYVAGVWGFCWEIKRGTASSLASFWAVCMVRKGEEDMSDQWSHQFWVSPGGRNGPSEDGQCLQVSQPTLPGPGLQNQPSIQHCSAWVWLSSGRAGHRSLYHRSGNQVWPVPWAGKPTLVSCIKDAEYLSWEGFGGPLRLKR